MKGKGGNLGGKTDEELVRDLIHIHNAENWLGMDGDSDLSMFHPRKGDLDDSLVEALEPKGIFPRQPYFALYHCEVKVLN